MKFVHTETQADGGGWLTITSENKAETIEIIQHFRVFEKDTPEGIMATAAALSGDSFTYESKPSKRFWYAIESALDYDSTKPYADLICRLTGFGADGAILPDLDLTPFHPRRLCHTHITDRLWLDNGHLCFLCYDQAEEWNGKDAATNAAINTTDYMVEDFGFRRFEREYTEAGNGRIVRNPNYFKRHKAQPGLGSEWLWAALWNWWSDNKATPEQRRFLELSKSLKHNLDPDWALRKGGGEQAGLVSYSGLYVKSDEGHDWDGKGTKFEIVPWEKFAALSGIVEVA